MQLCKMMRVVFCEALRQHYFVDLFFKKFEIYFNQCYWKQKQKKIRDIRPVKIKARLHSSCS